MIGKSAQAPTPPDPTVVANAQSAANIASSTAQQKLNMVGSNGPSGSVLWQADPTQPGGYTQNTTLSPQSQQAYNAQVQDQIAGLGAAGQAIGNVNTALQTPFSYSGLPALQSQLSTGGVQGSIGSLPQAQTNLAATSLQSQINPGGSIQTGYSTGAPVQSGVSTQGLQSSVDNPQAAYGFTPQGQIQTQIGNQDVSGAVNSVQNATWQQALSRLDPLRQQQGNQLQAQLAAQGLGANSAAYQNQSDIFNRGQNDAYTQALLGSIQQGANEQNVLFNQQAQQGQFANAAQAQQFGQQQTGLQDYNSAAAQNFGQNLQSGQFANQAANDTFNQNLQQGQFANSAQAQQYAQNQALAQFGNQATQQQLNSNLTQGQFANQAATAQFGQNQAQLQAYNQAVDQMTQQALATGQFANAAQAQAFAQQQAAATFQNQARTQGAQEQAYAQNLPINQYATLSGAAGQVANPTGPQYTPTSVAPTDVTGAYALNSQVQQQNYQAQLQQQNSLFGGLFGLGSAALSFL